VIQFVGRILEAAGYVKQHRGVGDLDPHGAGVVGDLQLKGARRFRAQIHDTPQRLTGHERRRLIRTRRLFL
jgi:hypothetical protein